MPKRTQLENDAGHEHITQPEEEEVIYTALGSQVRREIIAFIEEKEKVGFVDLKQKPARQKKKTFKGYLISALEMLLLPVAGFFFTALPGIDAHTRLMLGRYIEYRVTEKV